MDKLSMAIIAMEAHVACSNERLRQAWNIIHAKLVEENGSSHNKPMPKLPTLEECQAHVQREMWGSHMLANSVSITERVYDFICRQLSA